VLRHQGKYEVAGKIAREALNEDPLHPWAGYELYLAEKKGEQGSGKEQLRKLNQVLQANKDQSHLEMAANYINCGLQDDALLMLEEYSTSKGTDHPMVHYYMGYLYDQTGEEAKATRLYKKAASMPPDYCFPFRLESLKILKRVAEAQPEDDRAHYYLGNLLYHYKQEKKAIEKWKRSEVLNSEDGRVVVIYAQPMSMHI